MAKNQAAERAAYERGFIHLAEAWYAQANRGQAPYVDDVAFGLFHKNGSGESMGQISVEWYNATGGGLEARLSELNEMTEIMVAECGEVLAAFSTTISPEAFCDLLKQHGFRDVTERVSPYEGRR